MVNPRSLVKTSQPSKPVAETKSVIKNIQVTPLKKDIPSLLIAKSTSKPKETIQKQVPKIGEQPQK